MEIKITLKNGDNSQTVKFSGDPAELISGIADKGLKVLSDLESLLKGAKSE